MSKLKSLRISIPGEYRDLWLYKNRLYIWDRFGAMRFLGLDSAVKHLALNYGSAIASLAQTLIFRNDWKAGEQLRTMLRVQEIEEAFLQPFTTHDIIVIELPAYLFSASESEPYDGSVLDTHIYADRVYFGTPDGLLESYINSKWPERPYGLEQQIDFRISRIAVRYAAINASAEENGLHFARVRFTSPDEPIPGFKRADWRKIADYSLATSHASHNLLNYTDASIPSLFRAMVEEARTHEKARYEEQQVVGYQDATDLSSLAYSAVTTATKVTASSLASRTETTGEVQILGNSSYHLLATWNDRLRVIDIRALKGKDIEVRPSRDYMKASIDTASPEKILETYPIKGGFVVELFDSIRLITREGSFHLADGQVARIRTFTSSVRHKEAIATVEENSASLIGFYIAEDGLF